MKNLICEKCETETSELFMITTEDYASGQGSWCKDCTENYEPSDYYD
jgi:hypothetical protein